MTSKEVEEALSNNRRLQVVLNQRLARIREALKKNAAEVQMVKMAKSQSNFEILGGELFRCKDAADALDGQPSLINAVDFEAFYKEHHKYPTIREVGITYPSYFVDEDKCTYFLDPIPELEQCRDVYGATAINSRRWSKVAIRQLKTQFANKVKGILRKRLNSRLHPKSQMGDQDARKELDEARRRLKLLESDATDILEFNPYQIPFSGIKDTRENVYHTAVACKKKFIYEISKAFDTGPWKADEDRLLLNFEDMDKVLYWKKIILHSKLRRPLLHCIRRYKAICKEKNEALIKQQLACASSGNRAQDNLSLPRTATPTSAETLSALSTDHIQTVQWTELEDEQLLQSVSRYTICEKRIVWDVVVQRLDYAKSIEECKVRWKLLSTKSKKKEWSNKELRRLTFATNALKGVKSGHKKWPLVSKIMINRDVSECRAQYKRVQNGALPSNVENKRQKKSKIATRATDIAKQRQKRSRKKKKEKLYMDDVLDLSEF